MRILVIGFFSLISFHLLSQITIKIGTNDEKVFPLKYTQVDSLDDLINLKDLFYDKEIIGMGEATHGTKEFFNIKAKFFKFLVKNCNYRVFGIEASYAECCKINEYICFGIGNIDSVMNTFSFWIWKTEEIKELILWMKTYNQFKTSTEQIIFYGFDMQSLYSPAQYLKSYFVNDTLRNRELKLILAPILNKSESQIDKLIECSKNTFIDTIISVHKFLFQWLNGNRESFVQKYSEKEFYRLMLCVENFGQALQFERYMIGLEKYNYAISGINAANIYRDSCMANNIISIQRIETSKLFIWTHNVHIRNSNVNSASNVYGLPMGEFLKNNFKNKYYSIGFVFNHGKFRARQGPKNIFSFLVDYYFCDNKVYKIQECKVPIYKKNSLSLKMALSGLNSYFINLQNSTNILFSTLQKTYQLGAIFEKYKNCSTSINAKKQFDGLIYVDKTSMSVSVIK